MYVYVGLYFTFITRSNNIYAAAKESIPTAPEIKSFTTNLKNKKDDCLANAFLSLSLFLKRNNYLGSSLSS